MVVYYNLKESISSARKVFRLFRFFDEIKGLVDQVTQMLSINGVEAVDAAPYHLAYLLPGASQ